MSRRFTKIICAITAVVCALGITFTTACNGDFANRNPLGGYAYEGEAEQNGGFAVKAGKYIYFLNGVEAYTADNSYGTPVKGAVMRIHEDDLAARNYSKVDTVVPLIAYESGYTAGLFIYGDRIYYSTPSTAKNSDGEVQNSYLDFKSSKLDGTTMNKPYFTAPSNSYDYRYVEVDGTVYLVYVASGETLFDESTAVTNLHSYNTKTGKDTILAYNVESYMFDGEDKTNPNIYYTMKVYDFDNRASVDAYNQVYTVRADAEENRYDGSELFDDWDEETDYYFNSGKLVYDGVGKMQAQNATPFNYSPDGSVYNELPLTYSLVHYEQGILFYTRKTSTTGTDPAANLFSITDTEAIADGRNAVTSNYDDGDYILKDGDSAGSYKYVFENGKLASVLISDSTGIYVNKTDENGKLQPKVMNENNSLYHLVVKGESPVILFVDGDYLFYSTGGTNGYNFNRINYTGGYEKYGYMPSEASDKEYTPVKILDLDAKSDWYSAKLFDNQLIYASDTGAMNSYNYIQVCDLRNADNQLMSNAELAEFNELYEGVVDEIIDAAKDLDETIYANLENALNFAFYTGDSEYITKLAEVCNAKAKEDDKDAADVYSDKTLAKYADFINAEGDWAKYKEIVRTINGETVYANSHSYYYSVLGKMTSADVEGLFDSYVASYTQEWPAEEQTWWSGLSTAAQVWFIIGMCACGIIVIAGVTILVIFLVRRRNKKLPEYKKRIKVDTTDDRDVDVYADETQTSTAGSESEE